ncbi:MAG: NAD(P)H-dependent oxidoreductase [Proteobacteria bacterium]|nr:NAD(P)H-dependent oxidoreductase [Pseudomonadota bacterium]
MPTPRILALAGSLRARSLNAALLRAAARVAPATLQVEVYGGLGTLPLFNPDLEGIEPEPVRALQQAVERATALVIASPEYAHGVSGVLKNALDWLVAFPPFYGKAVAVLNASPRASHADAALRETLRTMSARIVEPASITVPLLGAGLDEDAIVASPPLAAALRGALETLAAAAGTAPPTPAFAAD